VTKKLKLEASSVFKKVIQEKLLNKDKKKFYYFNEE